MYDKRKEQYQILVTGSAKLDYPRRGGDSLQGRYHCLRMHPLTLAEITKDQKSAKEVLTSLLQLGSFPEPYFSQSDTQAKRWSKEYRRRLIREEITELEKVNELGQLELMAERLPDLVGSPLSIQSLREDIQTSHPTLTRWVGILENLYHIFRIYPFGAPKLRAVKKEAKHYHFDLTLVKDEGARIENLIALHLLKWVQFFEDTEGRDLELRYFRDVDKREVDFVIVEDKKPLHFIEVKRSAQETAPALRYLKLRFPKVLATQVEFIGDHDFTNRDGIRHIGASRFLLEWI